MFRRILALALTLAFAASCLTSLAFSPEEQYEILMETSEFIKAYSLYSEEGDEPLRDALIALLGANPGLYEQLMFSMLSGYDEYTMYIPAGMYDELTVRANYVGVGLTVSQNEDGTPVITAVNEAGSAYRAGVREGDVIYSVDGTLTAGLGFDKTADLLRGEQDTFAELVVLRGGERLTFILRRVQIGTPEFSSKKLEKDIYYMKYNGFDTEAGFLRFVEALKAMQKEGIKNLILDLRGNTGGSIEIAFNVINALAPVSEVCFGVGFKDANGEMDWDVITTEGTGAKLDKLVLLVDKSSASAAEIVMAGLTDIGCATAIGTYTYGKARGQYHVVLDDGSAVVVTSLQLIPAARHDYNEKGLEPDIEVQNYIGQRPVSERFSLREIALNPGNCSDDTERLSRALTALGYLGEREKAYRFDSALQTALDALRLTYGLSRSRGSTAEDARLINSLLEQYFSEDTLIDAQLQRALTYIRTGK